MGEEKVVVCFSFESFHKKMSRLVDEGWHVVHGTVRQIGPNSFLFRIR